MKDLICFLSGAFILLLILNVSGKAQNSSIEGNWLGALEFNGIKMRLALKVAKDADGALAASLDSLDQGVNNLKIDAIAQQEKAVRFESKGLGAVFEGNLNEKGDEIAGTFKQGVAALPLTFKRVAEIPALKRPQEPQKPYPYDEEEVSYENKTENVRLAGTLTLPREKRPVPAVILITGSGAQDRNETVAGHRPFLVLVDYLTRRGVAVLRVDDRGVGGSAAGAPTATSENYAGDVLAGVEYLKTRREINSKQIGLVGHSEGGMIAPIAAKRSKDVAFIVLLAGPGQIGEDLIYTQNSLLQKAGGASSEITAQTNALLKNIFAVLKTEPDNKTAQARVREAISKFDSDLSETQRKTFASVKASVAPQIPLYLSLWFRYFIAYDPRPTLEKVKIPVLAINGENDLQVSAKENLTAIEAALKKGGNKNVTIVSFPKLNHLLQTSETGSPAEYNKIEETIAPQALETIGAWILRQTVKR